MERARYAEVLRRLAASKVEFIVVGMTAGVLRGAPLVTFDPLEVVHRRSAESVARLLKVLAGLDAAYRLAVLPVLRATLEESRRRG